MGRVSDKPQMDPDLFFMVMGRLFMVIVMLALPIPSSGMVPNYHISPALANVKSGFKMDVWYRTHEQLYELIKTASKHSLIWMVPD
jgi:hypothetical protein